MVWSHGHTEDFEPLQAAEKQVKVLGMRSKERMTLFGGHFPWPGIGHVAKEERERERERRISIFSEGDQLGFQVIESFTQCCSQSQPVFEINYIYLVRPKNLSGYVSADNYVGSVASEGSPHVSFISCAGILWQSSAVC